MLNSSVTSLCNDGRFQAGEHPKRDPKSERAEPGTGSKFPEGKNPETDWTEEESGQGGRYPDGLWSLPSPVSTAGVTQPIMFTS